MSGGYDSLDGQPASPRPVRNQDLRLYFVAMCGTVWALAIVAQLFHLQVLRHHFYLKEAQHQSDRTITVRARRGTILDRNERPFAISVDAPSIYADPSALRDPREATRALGRALGYSAAEQKELLALLTQDRSFVWVKRQVDPAVARAVRDLRLEGVGFETESRRYYPKRDLLAPVLGYVGLDSQGMAGLEYALDADLKGREARVSVRLDARRRPMGEVEKPPTEGRRVTLTIDERLQHVTETALGEAIRGTGSVSGTAVVLDPRTGEVLAMSSLPSFNPNRFASFPEKDRANRAIADSYEPGSIFKIITAATALQEGVVSPLEMIDCGNGFIEIAGTRINDHHVFTTMTFQDVIAKSSDIGVVRVAQRIGTEKFYSTMRAFGFGTRTGIGLPGETAGLLRNTKSWSALSLASMSFGQEVGVTAIQMASAAAVIANGGYWMRPYVVKRVQEPGGELVREYSPVAERKVIEPETADRVMGLLREVVLSGTGRKAKVEGFEVAGKTGTAQKIDASGRYSMIDHVASFVGYVPASRPALVILVSLDTPKGDHNEGGDVAAPLFARIATEAVRLLAIPPDDPTRNIRLVTYSPETSVKTTFAAERPLDPVKAQIDDPRIMPDLRGLSLREAALLAARHGLSVEIHGQGVVAGQTPLPGTPLEPGMTCSLQLSAGSRAGTPQTGTVVRPDR
ncbi:MAG: penicillin-binding transpeptidase domain-containing protein [Vicinamibacteria bacterium]